jgi:serine/threonine-protein kinase
MSTPSDTRAIFPAPTAYAPPDGARDGARDGAPNALPRELTDRFALERELGGAGPCRVLLARERASGRVLVLKALGGALEPTEPSERARFEREIALTARLRHPSVIDVLDAGVTRDGCLYYTMPFVAGETLHERIARGGPLPVCESLRIARALADALHHAHRRGIVHRDVKPANVLLAPPDGDARQAESRPVLIDFGIACTFDDSAADAGVERITATGLLVGTPAYMSPEQSAGEQAVDGRADVYALGCVLYEMLTGEPPFSGRTDVVLCRRLRERPPRPRALRRELSRAVDGVVVRALAPLVTSRFRSAAEFGAALDRAAGRSADGAAWHTRGWRALRSLAGAMTP